MTYEEFKTQYSIRLNRQQEEAVRQTEGPVLLLAVPGSGKTTVLVTRLGYMLHCKGIRPEQILTVTYNVAATKDMKARYAGFFGEEHAGKSRRMDYDDQMVFTYRIFRQYPDILAYFQRRWPYICVDEAQDTSKIQHAILRLLASGSGNIFMVGDEDQSIYGFRAAWPQALLEFEQVFPGAKVLKLETNYRSTRTIVEKADAFIRRNQSRRPKKMCTENQQGSPIRRIMLEDYNRQYNYLLKVAENCTESTAVLYRNNDSALPLIDLLEQKGVPYACRQREGAFATISFIETGIKKIDLATCLRQEKIWLTHFV